MSEPQYYIKEGVRRAVAARELGLKTLEAWLEIEGQPDRLIHMSLDQLHSPRDVVSVSHPRYQKVSRGMSTLDGRSRMPGIVVEPLGASH